MIFQSNRFLRSTIVLGIDMLVSTLASLSVLLFAGFFGVSAAGTPRFGLVWTLGSVMASVIAFAGTRSYRSIIRYSTVRELAVQVEAVVCKDLLMTVPAALLLLDDISWVTLSCLVGLDFLISTSALILVRVMMLMFYDIVILPRRRGRRGERQRVLVYGDGDKSAGLSTRLASSTHFEPMGYITPGDSTSGKILMGRPIYGFTKASDVSALKTRGIDGILFAHPSDAKKEMERLVEFARYEGLKLWIAPTINELRDDRQLMNGIRNIRIEDLLGREEIDINMDEVRRVFSGKTVLVTGAAGSIGSELCRQLASLGVRKLVMLDNAESPLHAVRLEFDDRYNFLEHEAVIGDVRSRERLDYVFRHHRPDIVFHAAAYKHVPLMEENPCEAVAVNVCGSRNVADKCVEYGVEQMVMVSTDKAVNPTNIMGCTKRLAEIYVQSLGLAIQEGRLEGHTRFITTRFGNVLGSNGSVIPRFKEQIAAGGPVTVTHPDIRRFFMTIPEACRLVMEAVTLASGTQIFVFDMGEAVKIVDLAERMIHLAGYEVGEDIKIVFSGLRPGEKLYEEVLADKENTIPTDHSRIFKAKVRQYDYAEAAEAVAGLDRLSAAVEIPAMVKLMKAVVPEFKSQHSQFEIYDHPESKEEK